jgi:acetoin utilization protein AcuB
MLVKNCMNKHPITVRPEMSVKEVKRIMGESQILYLPVVDSKNKLTGLVTHQSLMIEPDLFSSLDVCDLGHYYNSLTVKRAMIKNIQVVTISKEQTIEEAAYLMLEKKVGCLPVVEYGLLIGLITNDTLLMYLAKMLGVRRPAVRATIQMPDRIGELAKMVSAISSQGWGIMASGGTPDADNESNWIQVVKIRNVSLKDVKKVLTAIPDQRVLDIRETC